MKRPFDFTMIAIACSAVTSSSRIVTVPATASLTTMLILAWRASRRRTAPTSSPWNSRTPTPPLSVMLSGSTGPGEVAVVAVVAVVVEVVVAGAGEAAAVVVEAWTSRRLSLLVGTVGNDGSGLVLVSVTGAFATASAGLKLGAGEGELVCAFRTGKARASAAPAQRKILKRLGIDGCVG